MLTNTQILNSTKVFGRNAGARRSYNFNGLAGCVQQRKARSTGTLVGVYDAVAQGIETEYPWVCVCEAHGNCVCFDSLRLAKFQAVCPEGWCEDCREALK
jgi:hypothetical protein